MKNNWLIILLVIVGTLAFSWRSFNPTPGKATHTTDTIRIDSFIGTKDTIEIIKYVPRYLPGKVVVDTFWKNFPVDTAAILADYYTKYPYQDTIVNDSNLTVVMSDTIFKNRVYSRVPFIAHSPTIITKTIKETVYIEDKGWYAGGYAGQSFGVKAVYKNGKFQYGGQFGTDGASAVVMMKISK